MRDFQKAIVCSLLKTICLPPPRSHTHLTLFLSAFFCLLSFQSPIGSAIRRDLGPRILSAIAGWGAEAFTAHNYYFVVPLFAPLIGGVLGGAVYRTMIHTEVGRGKTNRRLSGNINDGNDSDDGDDGALLATHPPSSSRK
jgi:hypothetical protein